MVGADVGLHVAEYCADAVPHSQQLVFVPSMSQPVPHRVWAKDEAFRNMSLRVVTKVTSQEGSGWLKLVEK